MRNGFRVFKENNFTAALREKSGEPARIVAEPDESVDGLVFRAKNQSGKRLFLKKSLSLPSQTGNSNAFKS